MAKDWPPSFPFKSQKEKKEGEREEIWRETGEEEELAYFPLSSSASLLPPSGSFRFLFFFPPWLFGRKCEVKGEQEVSRVHLARALKRFRG